MVLAGAQRRVDVAPIEATSAHENLQTVHESVFMAAAAAAAVDGGEHRIGIINCMDVQYAPWIVKLG